MADLGLDLYAIDPSYREAEDEATAGLDSAQAFLREDQENYYSEPMDEGLPQIPSELPLPPLPDDNLDDFTTPARFKYAEEYDFLKLHEVPTLEKIFLCVGATAFPRKIWICKQLPYLLEKLTFEEALAYVFPLALRLCQDEVLSVREALVENLDELLLFYYQPRSQGVKIDVESLVQLLGLTLFSCNVPLYELSKASLIRFCEKLPPGVFELEVLPILIRLLLEHEQENPQNPPLNSEKYIAQDLREVKLLRTLYPICQPQTINEVLIPILESHYTNDAFEIRKEILMDIETIIEYATPVSLNQRLYPIYSELAQDSVYEVRQMACDVLTNICKHLIDNGKRQESIDWMVTFLNDPSQKVRSTAASLLGKFLYMFNQSEIPEMLLTEFFDHCKSKRTEIRLGCAHHLPAVVLLLGPSRWNVILTSFTALVKDRERDIQLTLSSSIHELAKILNPEQTNADLLPVFRSFVASLYEEVRYAALKNSSDLLHKLYPEQLTQIIPALVVGFKKCLVTPSCQTSGWRDKEPLLKQLNSLLEYCDPSDGVRHIFPLLVEVARIRTATQVQAWALERVPYLYAKANSDECKDTTLVVALFDQFDILLRSAEYHDRLLYALLCRRMFEVQEPSFDQFFLPNLTKLKDDPVVDVRLYVDKLLSNIDDKAADEFRIAEPQQVLTQDLLAKLHPNESCEKKPNIDSIVNQMSALTLSS